jgi:hypothetical protein
MIRGLGADELSYIYHLELRGQGLGLREEREILNNPNEKQQVTSL